MTGRLRTVVTIIIFLPSLLSYSQKNMWRSSWIQRPVRLLCDSASLWFISRDFSAVINPFGPGDPCCSSDIYGTGHIGSFLTHLGSPLCMRLSMKLSFLHFCFNMFYFPFLISLAAGCSPGWEKHKKKCYFFSQARDKKDRNSSCKECAKSHSDPVIVNNKEELVRSQLLEILAGPPFLYAQRAGL